MILAGDIGGTNTRLAIFEQAGEGLKIVKKQTFPSREYVCLEEIIGKFLAERDPKIDHACLGIAGPVKEGRCEATNLPWIVDSTVVANKLGLPSVELINDLEANLYGIATLDVDDFTILNEGDENSQGNAAIIAAGTGLGEAGLYSDGRQYYPFACEGGHSDFAPRNELETKLLHFLLNRFESVSFERVLSGPGLFNIYQFLRDTGHGKEPQWLAEEMQQKDPAAVISKAALNNKSELCALALDLFVSLYGAEGGNLALKIMATGGLFIGGGIAPKIVQKLSDGAFMKAFTAKGRFGSFMEAIPVRIILNDKTALRGAAHYVMLRAADMPFILRK